MYALDTNSVIHFFKGRGRIADRLAGTPPADVRLPAVVLYELEVGIARSTAPQRLRSQLAELLAVVDLLPFGPEEARKSAGIRARLERAGIPIDPLDTLIAGTAVAHGATLVTHNTREFQRIEGLEIDDWY